MACLVLRVLGLMSTDAAKHPGAGRGSIQVMITKDTKEAVQDLQLLGRCWAGDC